MRTSSDFGTRRSVLGKSALLPFAGPKTHQHWKNPYAREMGFLALVPIRGLKIVEIMGYLGFFVEMMGFLGSGPIIQDLGFLTLPFSNHLVINKHIHICKN